VSPPIGGALRWSRAVLVALCAWVPASAGHVIAGGRLPGPAFLIILVGVTAWPMTLALRGCASRRRLMMLLAAAQTVMHLVFTLYAASSGALATRR
jgi:hypothetical protein